METKKSWKDKIEKWWNDQDPETKGCVVGTVITGIIATISSAIVYSKLENRWIAENEIYNDAEKKIAYQHGLQDGQIKAYHDILFDPANTFKKLGMDVKQF